MMPIGPLMVEHRLIERMIKLMEIEMQNIERDSRPDTDFIERACDFLKTYADMCHHGKEEDILFNKLKDKNLSAEHKEILNSLMEDHKLARKTTSDLAAANKDYKTGLKDRVNEIRGYLKALTDLYPEHIRKEDKVFFIPSMSYFTDEEKDEMLESFNEFDRNLIHEKYKSLVADYEKTNSAESYSP